VRAVDESGDDYLYPAGNFVAVDLPQAAVDFGGHLGRAPTVKWWLHDCDPTALTWARLRVFDDNTSDACWNNGGTLYGFDEPRYAGYFLAEDEYRQFVREPFNVG